MPVSFIFCCHLLLFPAFLFLLFSGLVDKLGLESVALLICLPARIKTFSSTFCTRCQNKIKGEKQREKRSMDKSFKAFWVLVLNYSLLGSVAFQARKKNTQQKKAEPDLHRWALSQHADLPNTGLSLFLSVTHWGLVYWSQREETSSFDEL